MYMKSMMVVNQTRLMIVYGHEMNKFSIITFLFEVFYDNSKNDKRSICYNYIYIIAYVKVKSVLVYYEPYDYLFN